MPGAIYTHQIDTPFEAAIVGVPGTGEIYLRYPLPVMFDYHHVEGQIIIVAYDYTARPTLNNLRILQTGRQLVIVNVANLPAQPGFAFSYNAVALAPLLSLRDTDIGFLINTDYDASSNVFEIRATVAANPAVAGFMLSIRPRLTITAAARNVQMVESSKVIGGIPIPDDLSGRVEVKFGAREEPVR